MIVGFQSAQVNVSLATEPVCSKFDYEEKLLEKMIRTEIKVEAIESEIVKTQDSVLKTLNEIKKKVADINDKFEDLRNNITEEMIAKTKDLEKKEELFKNSFEELRTKFTNDMENQRNALTVAKEEMAKPSVAFYAHHVTDLVLDVSDEIIVFDTIITNEGSGYDTSTGIFTAPVEGLYQFTVHVCSKTGKYSVIGLSLAGKVVAAAVNYDKDSETCSSVGAVVRMNSGEQIWVKCTSGYSTYRLYQDNYRMNTFSGILLNN
ncbi:complement C1q and tumor necrosis factor-related protein 9A-like isoform X2 [Mercenaria mercenaria]|uniref:complement C1q and tumor necrosis factor-related protein 9A-like isoform X2 n=1 Tax=Mercenaria mercenaria TaxID=6596 RepID=UPI00234F9585|nr:complement C1q and tumor necrosis factor-related protein 9A-like isoform X2 [Mercenaria mercenaria]